MNVGFIESLTIDLRLDIYLGELNDNCNALKIINLTHALASKF